MTAHQTADYVPITDRLISFGVQESFSNLNINTASADLRVEGEERFEVCLANPIQGALGLNGLIRCTTVVIEDTDSKYLQRFPQFILPLSFYSTCLIEECIKIVETLKSSCKTLCCSLYDVHSILQMIWVLERLITHN